MFTTYTVIEKFKNGAKIESARVSILRPDGSSVQITANSNNVAVLKFVNDSDANDIHIRLAVADNLSDAAIDDQARNIIASLNAQDTGLAGITVGAPKVPDPEAAEIIALRQATLDYGNVVKTLRVEEDKVSAASISDILHDQYVAAYNALVAAQDAVSTP